MAFDSIPARFLEHARKRPDAPAFHAKRNGIWEMTPWKTYVSLTRSAAKSMMALGLQPGQAVCILGFNRPEWVIFDLACMMAAGAPAGIYTTCSPQEVQYIIHHTESPLVLVENDHQWQKVRQERDNLPHLKYVIMMDGAPKPDDPMVLSWKEFLEKGAGVPDADLDGRINSLDAKQLATFIYTSGTTGPPKGVMLSHENLSWTANIARDIVKLKPDDISLSYLPLSHIAEQMFTIHVPCTTGSSVYFAESMEKVADNFKEVQPTVVFGVPRIWEKFHAGVNAKLREATGVKASLIKWATGVGREVTALRTRGQEPSGLLAFQYGLASKLIFSKLKPALGLGRARALVSGAAPIAKEVLEFFGSLDLIIMEVYGQSEDSGPTTFNVPGKIRFGSVGAPIPGVEVKIAPDGEILVKGPNVFLGYYKEPAATAETLVDGWLHSGDVGEFDKEGFLWITGRKKEIIITSGGKNIAPKNIEEALKTHELIAEAVVIGDRRKFLSALVTLDMERAKKFAEERGLPTGELHKLPAIQEAVQAAVDNVNEQFARVEHIRKFAILPRNFSIEAGELTPTLKIKRKKVNQNWEKEIEAMYAE